ncbi:hypothetical protein [Argonema antarcticum]|uniref:hypothetical protein n=1 Tax=Argonema antarcticum TaxID=2942763 RepID=UPI002012E519|nr:hypothetical protein [Argonema antarcticum]MCL1471221.1 hypothetical protein [Argonema antarcticum A004/B2]
MENLSKLLEIDNSELARSVRFYLHGLRGGLEMALSELPADPGAKFGEELLKELEEILRSPTDKQIENDSPWEDVFEPVIANSSKLIRLKDVFESDNELRSSLGAFDLKSTADADLWKEIQLKLLRIPETLAQSWRDRTLSLAKEAGAESSKRSQIKLPFTREELLYPGLSGTIQASGLQLSAKTPLDPRVASGDGDLNFLAGVGSTWIKFIEIDTDLHHALKSVYRFGVKSLESKDEQSKYITALIDCFDRAKAAEENTDPAVTLRARIDLDEAIHSLVYLPPCDRDSWWGKLQQESRRTLNQVADKARKAGHTVQIRPLWGLYADIRPWSKDDLELDSGSKPGEVLACLRVYAKINEEALPGRVLFRSFNQPA